MAVCNEIQERGQGHQIVYPTTVAGEFDTGKSRVGLVRRTSFSDAKYREVPMIILQDLRRVGRADRDLHAQR